MLNPIELEYNPRRLDYWLNIAASIFNRLYANRPSNRVHCYAELAFYSLMVAMTIILHLLKEGWLG